MSESQFEKMLRALKDAERQRDSSRYTIEVQDEIINDLREQIVLLRELVEAGKEDRKSIDVLVDENLRLRELMRNLVKYAEAVDNGDMIVDIDDFNAIEREVGDE